MIIQVSDAGGRIVDLVRFYKSSDRPVIIATSLPVIEH